MITLTDYRKLELQQLAEAISNEYFANSHFEPEIVAKDNRITYSYGNYENAFDGLLEHRFGKFHIYLNLNRIKDKSHPRMRFTFAHELGHYFIDEHRNALKSGKVPSHPSFNTVVARSLVEREADFFGACLLMPSIKFRGYCVKKPLCGNLISSLADYFKVSISSVIFRYFDLSLFPMMLVMSKRNKIEWRLQTMDFCYRYLASRFNAVPPTTAASEFFQSGVEYKTEEIVFAEDWFSDFSRNKNEQFFEKCYYLSNDRVLSVIWKKEK